MTTHKVGQLAEKIAEEHLLKNGCKIRETNFRCQMGEIDLILYDKEYLVFVEVRYRGKEDFGSGAETVSHSKRVKIIRTAKFYLQKNNIDHSQYCRFDVISITVERNQPKINWIKDAFSAF